MKKLGVLLLLMLCIAGCGKKNLDSVINDYKKMVTKHKTYELVGTMEIINNDDVFKYDLNVKYLSSDEDYYKVSLINQTNNHEQVILKNDEGVYVITPSLNKSFKFQSDWPDNGSQSYLLESIANDMENDKEAKIGVKGNKYIITNKVNYQNNEDLEYEKVYLKKNMIPEKVEVYNRDDNVKIKVDFKNVDFKISLDEDDFALSSIIKNECDEECQNKKQKEDNTEQQSTEQQPNKKTSSINDIIYPLYIPENTTLKSKDVIDTDDGQRVILTFSGDNSFVLVEETASLDDEFEIIPVYGDPQIINDSIGALSANSLSWTSNNINYYLTGSSLSKDDMITIATSMSNIGTVSLEK